MKKQQPFLELSNLTKSYVTPAGEYQALKGMNLQIKTGEFVAIMGPSGSGKSTLMHILGALDTPTQGKYLFDGKDITNFTSNQLAEIRNQKIGFVFQSFNLLPRTTVLANVEKPMIYANIDPADRTARAMNALEEVGLTDKANNLSNHISGGQIQRVAIARAMVMEPMLLLADEPTGNLDTATALEVMDYIKELNQKGHTIIVITHEDEIARFANRIIKIRDGKLESDTTRAKRKKKTRKRKKT